MENNRETWPEGCTQSNVADENGATVYYDVKPLSRGRMAIGLYQDAQCSVTYSGSLTVKEAIQVDDENDDGQASSGGPDFGTTEWFDEWNSALDVYRTCQPCLVSSLSNSASDRRQRNRRRRRLDEEDQGGQDDAAQEEEEGEEVDDDGFYTCQDAQGNQGANQCALFAQNTDIQPATFRDVRLASLQGSIVQVNGAGVTSTRAQKWCRAWGFFTIAAVVFAIGILMFCCFVKVKRRTFHGNANEPLLGKRSRSNTSNKSTTRK